MEQSYGAARRAAPRAALLFRIGSRSRSRSFEPGRAVESHDGIAVDADCDRGGVIRERVESLDGARGAGRILTSRELQIMIRHVRIADDWVAVEADRKRSPLPHVVAGARIDHRCGRARTI